MGNPPEGAPPARSWTRERSGLARRRWHPQSGMPRRIVKATASAADPSVFFLHVDGLACLFRRSFYLGRTNCHPMLDLSVI